MNGKTWDETTAECRIFTYKEGLLSRVGHDLELAVRKFRVSVDPSGAVKATFDPASVAVLHALRDGRPHPDGLSASDRAQVDKNVKDEVLHPARFKEISFTADEVARDGESWRADGELRLHGVTRPLEVVAHTEDGARVVRARLHQPDFGITPFKALMGTLRIKADLDVVIRLR